VAYRCALAIFSALISCLLLTTAASTSYASCGDWLQHDDKPSAAGVRGSTSVVVGNGLGERVPILPCSGPNCTRAPKHPVAPAPVNDSSGSMKSAVQSSLTSLAASTFMTVLLLAGNDQPAKGFPSSIDHPPRA
jgi:hypothetical protein